MRANNKLYLFVQNNKLIDITRTKIPKDWNMISVFYVPSIITSTVIINTKTNKGTDTVPPIQLLNYARKSTHIHVIKKKVQHVAGK